MSPLEDDWSCLDDSAWLDATRTRLATSMIRLDNALTAAGARVIGGTRLFRLAGTSDAAAMWRSSPPGGCDAAGDGGGGHGTSDIACLPLRLASASHHPLAGEDCEVVR